MALLSPMEGKTILDVGCGLGDFAVFLARQGARVTGIDIGENLVAAARALADVNQVDCDFRQGSITNLPVEPESFDLVLGLDILHHLSPPDVVMALGEVARVLKGDGVAVFHEPVENSECFSFLQNLFPTGKRGEQGYRPSLLQRRTWKEYRSTLDDRDMTFGEFFSAGRPIFSTIRVRPFGLTIRLERLLSRRHWRAFQAVDRFLFTVLPFLKRYCRSVLVEYRK